MTNAWLWWEKWKASSLLAFLLNFRVRGQFEIKMFIALGLSDINTTYFIWIKKEPAIIWKLVTCQRVTSEKIHDLDGSTPEPAIGTGDTGQQIPCFDSCQLLTTLMCNQWAPKVVRKCESKHWHACGADGRSVGVRSRDYQIFSDGYIITFSYPRCSAGALCVRELRYN